MINVQNIFSSSKEKEKENCSLPVVMIADLIAAGLQSGWSDFRRPTIPET
jgi:hypothetical protein